MTEMMGVYTSAASATPGPTARPAQDLQDTFPWLLAVSTSEAADQAWFWTPEWQEGEHEVDEHIAAGRTTYFDSVEEFLASLDRETG